MGGRLGLRVTAQVDNEDLVFTLEVLVEKFAEQIAPFAVDLARQLVGAFAKYSAAADGEGGEGDPDEDTGAGWAGLAAPHVAGGLAGGAARLAEGLT